MEPKRLSVPFGDDAHSRRGSPSGLRALTASPRLSLMRSRRDSYETTTSGVSSCSAESRVSSSCVTRHTSPEDCDRQRFIVWAAVLRNNCDKMSPSEKLECPLLRCRRRCESHEMMLKHLYECKLLASGEYWCYECEKPEMFTDVNCKRCAGHPGRRRRIMSHAKNFFSSLGHRSRKDGSTSYADDISLYDPPSLDSLDIHPQQVELSSSTEIVEIDSIELPPTRPQLPPVASNMQAVPDMHSHPTLTQTQGFIAEELRSLPASTTPLPPLPKMPDQLDLWEANLAPAGPCDPARPPSPLWYQERSSLQLNTSGLAQSQDQHYYPDALQSHQLSHSLSLRSNGSGATTASHGISPASVYSAAWTMGSAWDTDVTSLSSGMVSPVGCLSRGGSNASRRSCFDAVPEEHEGISELPADMPSDTSASGLSPFVNPESLGIDQMYDPLSLTTQTISMAPQTDAFLDVPVMDQQEHRTTDQKLDVPVDVESLVTTTWKHLRNKITETTTMFQHLTHNPLVSHLQLLGPRGIASTGLLTLGQALSGQLPRSAPEIICLMYLSHAFSMTLGPAQAGGVLDRSHLYSEHIPPDDRGSFLEAVNILWSTGEFQATNALPYADFSPDFLSESSNLGFTHQHDLLSVFDGLIRTSRLFLDELESSAVLPQQANSNPSSPSQLWAQHWGDSQASHELGSDLVAALYNYAVNLKSRFQHSPEFPPRLGSFLNRVRQGEIPTIRKAELELMRLGKGCFSIDDFHNIYIPEVQRFCDDLYAKMMPGVTPRLVYYNAGISLIGDMLSGLSENRAPPQAQNMGLADALMEDLVPKSVEPQSIPLDALDFGDLLTYGSPDISDASLGVDVPPESGAATNPPSVDGETTASTGPEDLHPKQPAPTSLKVAAKESCSLCGFRPKGHPRWFRGTMAKHMKNQHSTEPDKIYKCTFPGCKSEYRNRPDNLRQHQIEKGHLVEGDAARRPSKRKRVERSSED